jgi:hypothetical protein
MRPLTHLHLLPDPLLSPARHGWRSSLEPRHSGAPARRPETADTAAQARARLAPLLRAAAGVDLSAPAEVATLRAAGRDLTARLAAEGRLSPALVISDDDPDVVVVHTIAAAWRALTPAGQAASRVGEPGAASRWSRKPARASR